MYSQNEQSVWKRDWRWADVTAWLRRHPDAVALTLVYVAFFGLLNIKLWRPGYRLDITRNTSIAEAAAWHDGRLDIAARYPDTAVLNGRIYNVFPPFFSFVSYGVLAIWPAGVPHWLILVLLGLPAPWLVYTLLRRTGLDPAWAALLSLSFLLGTSFYPVARHALGGAAVYWVNHVVATVALCAFLLEYRGRRRPWAMALALLPGAWTRQLTVLYLGVVGWCWLRQPGGVSAKLRTALPLAAIVAVTAGVPMVLNALKFGSPLDSGYALIYVGREDQWAQDIKQGLFSPIFIPRNAYYMHLGLPEWVETKGGGQKLRPTSLGTGLWLTSPLYLLLLVKLPTIWRDRSAWPLLLATLAVMGMLLMYHATGRSQLGYHRFTLDFLPVWLVLIAPYAARPGTRWFVAVAVAWSLLYFQWLIRWA